MTNLDNSHRPSNGQRLDICADCFHGDMCDNYINGRQSCLYFADKHHITVINRSMWELESDVDEPNFMFKLLVCANCGDKANKAYNFCPKCGAQMMNSKGVS